MKRFTHLLLLALLFSFSAQLQAKSEKSLPKKYTKVLKAKGKRPIKILAIGNSFSEDAIENYLFEIAEAEGVQLIIGNMYIGGCSLERHWKNITNDAAAYNYRKVGLDGKLTKEPNKTILSALADEEWDFVSIQQVSSLSGIYNSYTDLLPQIMNFLYDHLDKNRVNFLLHQTWAYAKDSKHKGFAKYNNNQFEMYAAIITATKQAAEDNNIPTIIPVGTAIQNGRTTAVGDNFCRDGYHLDLNIGRFTAACTWYAQLFQVDATSLKYKPEKLSEYDAEVAKAAAQAAVRSPFNITILKAFQAEREQLTALLLKQASCF